MELNSVLFPAPKSSYSSSLFPDSIFWVPQLFHGDRASIPCLYLPFISGSSKILLYFHGNAEDLGQGYRMLDFLGSTLRVHVIAVEYPGYGIYPGEATAQRVTEDACFVFDYLTDTVGISQKDILIFGRSIGSGPATYLASHRAPCALILMSAFTSIRSVARHFAGWLSQFLVADNLRNIDLMPKVRCPTFIVHGLQDTVIPYKESKELHEACAGPSSLLLPKMMDHNVFDFLEDLAIPFAEFLHQCNISVGVDSHSPEFPDIPRHVFAEPPN